MKSYTDIKQSKKLAKILPIESADMHYATWTILNNEFIASLNEGSTIKSLQKDYGNQIIPCWSLASLLSVLPRHIKFNVVECPLKLYTFDFENSYIKNHCWVVVYEDYDEERERYNFKVEARGNKIIDACYEMILKLNELKLL